MNETNTDVQERVNRLSQARVWLAKHQVEACIIPSSDPHMSEYLPTHWQGRAWLSGFTGSVGTLVITKDFAGLWTDSRYWVQAPIELAGTGIDLQKMTQGTPTYGQWLAEHLPNGSAVAIDGAVLSMAEFDTLDTTLATKNISLKTDKDILQELWTDRDELPKGEIFVHHSAFVDLSSADKLHQVRTKMMEYGADFHLICGLDDIAWLTNLRGADVAFNPVFLAHLLIDNTSNEQDAHSQSALKATLFVDGDKLTDTACAELQSAGIAIKPYADIVNAVAQVIGTLLVDKNKVAIGTLANLSKKVRVINAMNPSTVLKAIKTQKEIDCIKAAMRQDGIALCEFFANLEADLMAGVNIDEVDIDTRLSEARSRQPHHVSASFDTIAGFGANGAIVHYRAKKGQCLRLQGDGLLLIDSGGQYQNGTTDITRMSGVGKVCDEAKRDVTYVLKAHIALARAVFPVGIASGQVDVLARNELWRYGLDYGHGTGHGVGYFLNVHEGPQVISRNAAASKERVLLEGMITSNEPGLYREGKWGVRLENLVVTTKAHSTEFGEFLRFETLTLCPFDTRLILPELLNDDEKAWLNAYHKKVRDVLIEGVADEAKAWLIDRTQAI